MSKTEKVTSIILGAFLLLLAGVYTAGVIFFDQKIMPRSTLFVDGNAAMDLSLANYDDIEAFIADLAEDTAAVQLDNDPDRIIHLHDDIDYHNNANEIALQIAEQSRFEKWDWPIRIFRQKDYFCTPEYDFNCEKLRSLIMSWTFSDEIPSANAYLDLNEKDEIVIIPEKQGTEIDKEALYETVATHIAARSMLISADELKYLEPETRSDAPSLKEELKYYEDALSRVLSIDVFGIEEKLNIRDMVDVREFFYNNIYLVDEEKLDQYMTYITDTYTTYEKARPFTTHDGRRILAGGPNDTYGFVVDYATTRTNIEYSIYDPSATSTEVAWEMTGYGFDQNNSDFGNTYIEISIAEQHLWYFKNGSLYLDTPVVTGMNVPIKRTPTGAFATCEKGRDVTLSGEMAGEKWESFVNYWIGVTWDGIGIHDAPWRGTSPAGYGGEIYKYNGSHGCINVPLEYEIMLYNDCPVGTVVVIY